jgi:hypothetical protein
MINNIRPLPKILSNKLNPYPSNATRLLPPKNLLALPRNPTTILLPRNVLLPVNPAKYVMTNSDVSSLHNPTQALVASLPRKLLFPNNNIATTSIKITTHTPNAASKNVIPIKYETTK